MLNIVQISARMAESLPTQKTGKPSSQDSARVKLEAYFQFWAPWLAMQDPFDRRGQYGFSAKEIFERRDGRQSATEMFECKKLLGEKLGIPSLDFGAYVKLRRILIEAFKKAVNYGGVDVALCAIMALVQLEYGIELDPEYGNFPEPDYRSRDYFNDEDLPEDPAEAEVELEMRHDRSEPFYTSDYNRLVRFKQLRNVIEDVEEFENAFPRAREQRSSVIKAARPLLDHLDPVLDVEVLELFIDWAKFLLSSPLLLENWVLRRKRAATPDKAMDTDPGLVP